jgi:hypothetical protein
MKRRRKPRWAKSGEKPSAEAYWLMKPPRMRLAASAQGAETRLKVRRQSASFTTMRMSVKSGGPSLRTDSKCSRSPNRRLDAAVHDHNIAGSSMKSSTD